jgi:hypothetical protein
MLTRFINIEHGCSDEENWDAILRKSDPKQALCDVVAIADKTSGYRSDKEQAKIANPKP